MEHPRATWWDTLDLKRYANDQPVDAAGWAAAHHAALTYDDVGGITPEP
jgi:hypothetical protein